MSLHKDTAERCLKCVNPSCQKGCPVKTEIPRIIKLFLENKYQEAEEILFKNNPLSAFCSLICPHENNCTGNCVLNRKNDPIKFYEIESYLSFAFLEKPIPFEIKENGHRAAIIGAGPAGLAVAILLRLKGFKITIIDSKDKIGGVLRYGIPEFRLPKSLLDDLLERMTEMGIQFRPNTLIGPTITIDDMFNDGYEAIFIGTGVWKPNSLKIPGQSLGNVAFAIDFLKDPDAYRLGNNVAIIGGGNTAIDVARTIIRKRSARVSIIFNDAEEKLTAHHEQINIAKEEGIDFYFNLKTDKIDDDGITVTDIKTNKKIKMDYSYIIIAIGQSAFGNIVNTAKEINTKEKGLVVTTEKGLTTRPGVFAGGDVVSGSKTVADAVAMAKIVAQEMEDYILAK